MFRKKDRKNGLMTMSIIGGMVGGMAAMYLKPQLEKQMEKMKNDHLSGQSEPPLSNMMAEMSKEIVPALTSGTNQNQETFQEMVDTFIEQEQ